MKPYRFALPALLLTSSFATANAYIGIGGSYNLLDKDDFVILNPISGQIIVGAYLNPSLAIEGRYGLGILDDEDGVTADIDSTLGLYFRPTIENDQSAIYGIIGFSEVMFTETYTNGDQISYATTSLSVGAGLLLPLSRNLNMQGEWMTLFERPGYRISGVSFSLVRSF
ncbi:outer membrane beta-barrel protein [Salinispirillum marinum]|uniref:Outer membrane beta-barrel protein n=2 Tax=Saccharospirillaceae TaxID=255527 RepID=A0ABV8BG80_9GAMM